MASWLEAILILVVLSDLFLLGSSRLMGCIRAVAFQGFVLAFLPLLEAPTFLSRALGLACAVMLLKGFVFPWLLSRALREASVSREVQPFVGYTVSLLAGILFLGVSIWLDERLHLPASAGTRLAVPVAFTTIFVGLFLIVSRRSALNQVLGYLVLENGIYIFGVALVGGVPLLVELGVLMDVFVAVFVMGIAIYRIQAEFDHIDADRLRQLKG